MLSACLATHWLEPLCGKSTPLGRLRGARSWFTGGGGGGSDQWIWVAAGVVGLVAAASVIVLVRGIWRQRAYDRRFAARARQVGLDASEQKLLAAVARLAGVRQADAVFTVNAAFERGVSRILAAGAKSGARPDQIAAMVDRLREKLGLVESEAEPTDIGVGRIQPGQSVSVYRRDAGEAFDAKVAAPAGRQVELQVRPERPVRCRLGELWQLRYSEEGVLWEVTASVVRQGRDRVLLRLAPQARCVNRRRFARTEVSRPAFLARFPFQCVGDAAGPPTFAAAKLIEIAGPGLRLDCPLDVEVGERILIGVHLGDEKILQGLAVVRRADRQADGSTSLAAEMMALTSTEVTELSKVSLQARAEEEPAEAADESAAAEEAPPWATTSAR